ncbi:MAG: hypothetical protein JOZ15_19675 [Acidobacteria bacterium]|nr:hypothetical protein [Acidobacteriota bacterium]
MSNQTNPGPDSPASASPTSSPLKIVPMPGSGVHKALKAALLAGPTPQLTYNGGPLLANVEVFTVFWGSAWSQSPQLDLANQINDFFTFIVTSPLIDQLTAEYQVPAFPIGQGSFVGTFTITDNDPGAQVADADIQNLLQQEIGTNLPNPDANSLYFVFTPPGVTVSLGTDLSCQVFCGYHDAINGSIFYAVVPSPDCQGCLTPSGATLDAVTVISSHELCEAITDAIPGQGWYYFADQQNQGEIGDLCVGQLKQVGPYTVQAEYSNAAGGCV